MFVKRLSLSLLIIGVLALLVSATSTALFSESTAPESATFTAGTVDLGSSTTNLTSISNIVPGDSGTAGTYSVEYTGDVPAWLGLDASISGDLVTCDGGHLNVTIDDGHSPAHVLHAGEPSLLDHVILGPANPGDTVTIKVDYALGIDAGNPCEGDSATVEIRVKAVQYDHNSDGAGGPSAWN